MTYTYTFTIGEPQTESTTFSDPVGSNGTFGPSTLSFYCPATPDARDLYATGITASGEEIESNHIDVC